MLKSFCAACLVAFVLGQDLPFLLSGVLVDTIHGFGVEYDDNHNIVVFVGDHDCYVVEAFSDQRWDHILHTAALLHQFTENVYKQIEDGLGLHDMTFADMRTRYHSSLANRHCADRTIHRVTYLGTAGK